MDGIKWEKYLQDIQQIYEISNELSDDWEIIQKNNDVVGGVYLRKLVTREINFNKTSGSTSPEECEGFCEDIATTEKGTATSQCQLMDEIVTLVKFEYHVLYHISYAVPYLCFTGIKSDGSSMTLDEAWMLFNEAVLTDYDNSSNKKQKMLTVLTQMEHPVLFKPFFTLHPCRTAGLLGKLPLSENKVLSYISTIGPAVHLNLDLRYAKMLNKEKL